MSDDPRRFPDPLKRLGPGQVPPQGAIPMGQTAAGLWVPVHLATEPPEQEANIPNATAATLRFTRTVAGWKALTGEVAPLAEVIEHLRHYSLREVVSLTTRISIALAIGDEHFAPLPPPMADDPNLRVQLRILERLAGPAQMRACYEQLRRSPVWEGRWDPARVVLFQERQTLNALKLALLAIDVDAPDRGAGADEFVLALFKLSDHLDPPESTMNVEELELYVAANLLFNESINLLADYVRAHTMYVEATPEVAAHAGLDLPTALARSSGMDAWLTWDALYALYTGWGVQTLDDLDQGRIMNRRSGFFASVESLTPAMRNRWFDLATWDIAELSEQARERYAVDSPRWFDVLPFEQRPLVSFGDEVFCTSLALFQRLPGRSLQHRLIDRSVLTPSEVEAVLNTRGDVVEHYTLSLLKRAFGERLIDEAALRERANGDASCDAAILYPDAVILIECKTFSVLLQTRHAENYAVYRDKRSRALQRAATQFASTVQHIRRGSFADLGLHEGHAREIYPVVMVFEQPISQLSYQSLRAHDLRDTPFDVMMQAGEVQPVQLVHIDEIELWERAAEAGSSVLELLRRKTHNPAYVSLPFHYFLHLENETVLHGHRRWAAGRWEAITDAFEARMRSLGLHADADDDR